MTGKNDGSGCGVLARSSIECLDRETWNAKQQGDLGECMKLVGLLWSGWQAGFEEAKQGWTGLWQGCHFDAF